MSEERPRHQRIKNIGNYLLQTVKKTGFWLCLIIIAMAGYIAYQQAQIDELATQVYGQHNMSDSDSFDYRITNLEHISNAHAARLKERKKIYGYCARKSIISSGASCSWNGFIRK